MKKCPYCGRENPDNEKVCRQCKAAIPINKPEQPKKVVKKSEKE